MNTPNQPTSQMTKALEAIGFSSREANVYVALLELGRGTVSTIARRASINRTTGYDILNSLVRKGLASVSGKEPKQEYAAESPEGIKKLYERELEKSKSFLEGAQNIIPQLKTIYSTSGRPQIRFYEGKEGMKDVYEDTLTAHETIRAYANVDQMHKTLPTYFPHYYERRVEKGIRIRAVIPANEAGLERSKHDHEEFRTTALVPPEEFYFSPEINIYDNKVMIASWKEELGVIIESAEIADAMKKVYELAWRGAGGINENTTG